MRCTFCNIAAGTSPASVVYEDDLSLAFLDTLPANPGHTLVIPKQHAEDLAHLPYEIGAHLFAVVMRVDRAIRASGLRWEATGIVNANGRAAGQTQFHSHIHIYPRFRGDGFYHHEYRSVHASRNELDEIAAQLRAAWPED